VSGEESAVLDDHPAGIVSVGWLRGITHTVEIVQDAEGRYGCLLFRLVGEHLVLMPDGQYRRVPRMMTGLRRCTLRDAVHQAIELLEVHGEAL